MNWSEERIPNEQIRYNHVVCETPLGLASIEWKGWKEFDSKDAYIDGNYISSCMDAEEAKNKIRQYLENKSQELAEFLNAPSGLEERK